MILLIGDKSDPHLIAIKESIFELGNIAVILDTSKEGLLETDFSYHSNGNAFQIKQGNQLINLSAVSAVFCASPLYARKGFISSQTQDFWYFTWKESLFGYFTSLKEQVFWVNHSVQTALSAQNKITFFNLAKKAGILTPNTLISNNKLAIGNFFEMNSSVVLKTMHQIYLEHNGEQTMLLVKRVSSEQFKSFETNNECPVFLQTEVKKKFDVRAIIVGDRVFGCKIDASKSKYGELDWRAYDLPKTIHSIYTFSAEIEQKLIHLMKEAKLDYACLDLCVDFEDQHWLLDINPFGKYLWIEKAIGLPISQNIADFLCRFNKAKNV